MTAVWGFIAQCEICPQKAILGEQPDEPWVCPRCAEVTDNVPYHGTDSTHPGTATVTLPAEDPLAQAIRNAGELTPIHAMVGNQRFVLRSWAQERQECVCGQPHGPAIVTTRWSPAEVWTMYGPGRFTIPDVNDDGYPISKVQG